jgi:hypothetical protein
MATRRIHFALEEIVERHVSIGLASRATSADDVDDGTREEGSSLLVV